MKTAEFKNYLTELASALDNAKSMTALDAIGKAIDIDYSNGKLTGRQFDLVSGTYNDRYTEIKDAIIAKNAAIEMANASANGGWKKDRKQETPADEYPDVLRVELCDPRFIKSFVGSLRYAEKQKGDKHMSNKKENTTPAGTQPAEQPVEVLKGEVIDTKQEKAINAAIDRISKKVENIGKGYLDIVGDVARLRSLEAWKVTGHKSLYDLCADKFGMARGTVANLEAVFKKYGDPETFKLTDACAGMSLREMLAAISEEKKALKGEVAGEPAYGEKSGEAGDKGGKKKAETLISITWELAGDDWNVEAILEEIRKQLEANPDAKEAFPDGANVSFTITH